MSSRPVQVASRRKRAQPAVSGGIPGSYDDKDSNFAWYAVSVNLLSMLVIKQPICYCHNTINQSMAVTDAGTKVPLYPYHTFYTLLVFKST